MAITATRVKSIDLDIGGFKKRTITDIALDSSYPTGGEAVTPANLGLSTIESAECSVSAAATTTVNVADAFFDLTNSKLILFDETPAQVANAADVAGLVVRVTAHGS